MPPLRKPEIKVPLKWHKVESSNIAAVAYDTAAKVLYVKFRSKAVYSYAGVLSKTAAAFLDAESKGKFFDQEVKDKFEASRVAV